MRVRFNQNNFGKHFIQQYDDDGQIRAEVEIDMVWVAADPRQLRELLNGLANLLQSASCHIPPR